MTARLDINNELTKKCQECFPNLKTRLIFSIGLYDMVHGSKTDYFNGSEKIGHSIIRHYNRHGLPIYNDKQRNYIEK